MATSIVSHVGQDAQSATAELAFYLADPALYLRWELNHDEENEENLSSCYDCGRFLYAWEYCPDCDDMQAADEISFKGEPMAGPETDLEWLAGGVECGNTWGGQPVAQRCRYAGCNGPVVKVFAAVCLKCGRVQ